MDDGPKPMKNLKPTKKNLNSADQFWRDHQAGYEEMTKASVDWTERVENHNAAYPKLRDELDRRRSITQVKVLKANKNRTYDPKCKACNKLKQLAELQKLNVKPKCRTRTTKKKYQREIKTRVNKRSRNTNRMKPSYRRKFSTRNCRVQLKNKYTGMDDMCLLNDGFIQMKTMTKSQNDNSNNEKSGSKNNSYTNSMHTLKSPDTSDPSISSYNTYASMDHEPMVSMD
ncbi:unnamed protein product [Euphydryas editha]|uniref:Uncharacterized protein n=1 Tax=Euphydryas editha TaxID=104508 RepID=A0AAU9US03_EUPED|nr:unnamed protein product [Euphydryas editha]